MLLAPGGVEAGQREETLITGGGDGVIKLWSLDGDDGGRPREVGILDDGKESGEPVLSIVLDGTILYGGRVDGWINVWDLETKQILRNIDTRIREDVLTLSVGRGLLFAALVNGTVLVCCARPNPYGRRLIRFSLLIRGTNALTNGRVTVAESLLLALLRDQGSHGISQAGMTILLHYGKGRMRRAWSQTLHKRVRVSAGRPLRQRFY